MKKLLAMYICVSALIYGSNAIASGLDMPPHDNSYTHHSLVPESVFDNSSSYQIARTYFMPDYQRNLVGKRVENGGKEVTGRTCEAYGFVSNCTSPAVGKGVKHPIPGLTCYEKCVSCADSGYVENCTSPMTGTKVTTADGLTCYKDCKCSITYRYTTNPDITPKMLGRYAFVNYCASPASVGGESCSQPYLNTTTNRTETVTLYKNCTCPSDYDSPTIKIDASCISCSVPNGTTMYKCVTNCNAYTLTVCPDGCNCSSCPTDSSKYKILSAKEGWVTNTEETTCLAVDCPAGYTRGVTSCSKGSYSSNGYSGGQVCGKCTLSDECPTGYSKTVCTSTQKETGRTTTEAGTTCYKCEAKDDTCPSGYQKSSCSSSQKQTGTTQTELGTTCYKCAAKDDTCPSGYQKSSCSSSQKQTGTTQTELGTTCYKCAAKDDTCPSGYQKSSCSSTQKQTGTTTTEAGTTCYMCEDKAPSCDACKAYAQAHGLRLVTTTDEARQAINSINRNNIYICGDVPLDASSFNDVPADAETKFYQATWEGCSQAEGAPITKISGRFTLDIPQTIEFYVPVELTEISIYSGSRLIFQNTTKIGIIQPSTSEMVEVDFHTSTHIQQITNDGSGRLNLYCYGSGILLNPNNITVSGEHIYDCHSLCNIGDKEGSCTPYN